MLFRNTGALAALLLFTRAALAAPTLNATATDETCEPDETITSTVHVSGSGSPPPAASASATDVAALSLTAIASGAAAAPPSASGLPAANGTESVVTEVFYTTNIHTVTSCAESITDCPARSSSVLSTQVAAVTTTYTISASGLAPSAGGAGPSGAFSSGGARPSAATAIGALGAAAPSGFGYASGAAPSGPVPSGSGGFSPSGPAPSGPVPSGATGIGALGAAAPSGFGYASGAAPSGPLPSGSGGFRPSGPAPSGPVPSGLTAIGAVGAAAPSGSGYITGAPLPSGFPSGVPKASGAGLAAANNSQVQVVTETFYSTNIHTVLSCAASVTNCPLRNQSTTSTELIPTSTQVVTLTLPAGNAAAVPTGSASDSSPASATEQQTTLTVQVTQMYVSPEPWV